MEELLPLKVYPFASEPQILSEKLRLADCEYILSKNPDLADTVTGFP